MKSVVIIMVLGLMLVSCSKGMTADQYIDAMSTLGCKGLMENSPGAAEIFKEKGITIADIQKYRKTMKAEDATKVAGEIVKRVGECHGVKM